MNEQDRVTWLLAVQDAGFAAGMRAAEERFKDVHRAADPARLESGFQRVRDSLTALAGSAAIGLLIRGIKDVHREFAEAELAVAGFNRATKAGGIDERGVAMLRDYAEQMKRFGFDDEQVLSVQRVALNLGMGAEQAREFARVALDLGGPLGKVEEAAQALAMAHNGSARGLRQFGIYIDENKLKAEGLNAVVAQSDRLFKGAGQEMETAAARSRMLSTVWGDLKEDLGSFVAVAAEYYAQLFGLIDQYNMKAAEMAGNNPLMRAAQEFDVADRAFQQARKQYLGSSKYGATWDTQAQDEAQLEQLGRARAEALNRLRTEQFFKDTPSGAAPVKFDVLPDAEAAKAAALAAAKLEEQRYKAAQGSIEEATQALRDYWQATQAVEELERAKTLETEAARYARVKEQIDANVQSLRDYFFARQELDTMAPPNLGEYEGYFGAGAYGPGNISGKQDFISNFNPDFPSSSEVGAIFDEAQFYWEAEEKARQKNHEKTLQRIADEGAAVQRFASAYQSFVGAVQMFKQGGLGGMVAGTGGLLTGLAQISPALAFLGPYGAAAGLGGTILSQLLDNAPRTEGGKARQKLNEALAGSGLGGAPTMSRAEFEAGGNVDVWQQWSEAISGSDKIGQGGEILASAFSGLGLTMGETADAVGHLIAQAQGLSEAAGDQMAAQEALLSASILTDDELREMAQLYGDSATYLEEEARLKKEILEDAKKYASSTGSAKEEAFQELKKDKAALVALMAAGAAEQQKSDAELQAALEAAGLDSEAAHEQVYEMKTQSQQGARMIVLLEEIAGKTDHAGYWPPPGATGTRFTRVLNSEVIAPEKVIREEIDRAALVGAGGRGDVHEHHHYHGVIGDHRDIIRRMSKETRRMRGARQIGGRRG